MSCAGKKQYWQSFREDYAKEFPFIIKSERGNKFAFCSICRCDLNISHGGKNDISNHVKSGKHTTYAKNIESSRKINSFFVSAGSEVDNVTKAECFFTSFLVEHNIALSVSDHAAPLFRKMFPDSEIVKKYACGRTKTTALVAEMARATREDIISHLQKGSYSVATDGTNDSDSKLYPIVVTYYNKDVQNIATTVLSLPELQGDSTGKNIGNLIVKELESLNVPLSHMIGFSSDNAAVMVGNKNGAVTVLLEKQKGLVAVGCVCHLINLAAEKGAACLPIKVDELLIDIFYYLEKSAKRKESLKKFQALHGEESKKILKHVCTRWLSLGKCLKRLVEEWDPLISFFKGQLTVQKPHTSSLSSYVIPKKLDVESSCSSAVKNTEKCSSKSDKFFTGKATDAAKKRKSTDDSESSSAGSGKKLLLSTESTQVSKPTVSAVPTREEMLFMTLSSPVNKAICLFLLSVIPVFDKYNTIFQSSSPLIHKLDSMLHDLLKELMLKFVQPSAIKNCALLEIKYHFIENQRLDTDLLIGSATSQIVSSLKEADKKVFYSSVRKYFMASCDYVIHKFPLKNEVLKKAGVANLENIESSSFSDVSFFVERFPFILPMYENESRDQALDELQSQFSVLQVEDIYSIVKADDSIVEKWVKVSCILDACGKRKFDRVFSVMQSILTLPHSNAECERVFSLVKKNRTQFRSQLSTKVLENMSLVKCKPSMAKCYEQNFSENFLKQAKHATTQSLKKN